MNKAFKVVYACKHFVHVCVDLEMFKYVRMKLPIDVLVCVPANTNAAALPPLFTSAICRQVDAIVKCLQQHSKVRTDSINSTHTLSFEYPSPNWNKYSKI